MQTNNTKKSNGLGTKRTAGKQGTATKALTLVDGVRKQLAQTFSPVQLQIMWQRTPAHMIQSRKGRGGKDFTYVDIGYVRNMLDMAFGGNWDFVIVEDREYPKTREVVVRGRLTVRPREGVQITKEQYGGSDIKLKKGTKTPVDNAIEYAKKSAASDALKKCASLIGIAADVYYPDTFKSFQKIVKKAV